MCSYILYFFFFFNDTATTEIYTLSLHDALPIYRIGRRRGRIVLAVSPCSAGTIIRMLPLVAEQGETDRKSTRLNSSHTVISYAVFCLKKKKKKKNNNGNDLS